MSASARIEDLEIARRRRLALADRQKDPVDRLPQAQRIVEQRVEIGRSARRFAARGIAAFAASQSPSAFAVAQLLGRRRLAAAPVARVGEAQTQLLGGSRNQNRRIGSLVIESNSNPLAG